MDFEPKLATSNLSSNSTDQLSEPPSKSMQDLIDKPRKTHLAKKTPSSSGLVTGWVNACG
eukprot:1734797-Amphidinium_carterae.1